jgi:pimeloyl-ACP methyl ester carboxylesterase
LIDESDNKFRAVYLIHGLAGSPDGSVRLLENALVEGGERRNYIRPLMPHANDETPPSLSAWFLAHIKPPQSSLVIGVSLGGLVAAALQETERPDLHVICICSPTWAGDVGVQKRMNNRVSLFSSLDPVIAGRTGAWPQLAQSYDLPWLAGHDTDPHVHALARIISGYLAARSVASVLEGMDVR